MKREFLTELGLEKDVIDKIMKQNGDDINAAKSEAETLKATLADKEKAVAELTEKIKSFDGNDEKIKSLQTKIDEFEKAEKDRKTAAEAAEKDRVLTESILSALNGREFLNDFTKDGILAKVKAELGKPENSGRGAGEILDAVTKDSDGIFKNPQKTKLNIPPTGGSGENATKEFKSFF